MDERREKIMDSRGTGERLQNARRRPGGNTKRPRNTRTEVRRAGKPRMSSRARRRKRNMIIRTLLLILLIIVAVGGFIIWKKYGSSNEKADLEQYYEITRADDLAVIVNNQIVGKADDGAYGAGGRIIDGRPYIEYSVLHQFINKRFYWDSNENVLLYTLPNGSVSVSVGSSEYTEINEKKSEDYVILKTEGKTAYVALDFVQKYTDMEYGEYQEPNRVMIISEFGQTTVATVKRDTEVRYQGGVKSLILTEIKKSDEVTVLGDEDGWKKVRTSDGFIGYVKTNTLKDIRSEIISSDFEKPVYSNISKNYTINMAWHNVDNETANGYLLETVASTKGLTTIAPTWFHIADTNGNLASIADSTYVNYAHQLNLEVWAVLRDFHGGINSSDETYEVLSYTSKRTNLINQVIAEALQNGIDGINLDFELISAECAEHYLQFVRELSVKCRQNGIVLSIDNYVPMPYNQFYDLEEQAAVADYIIIMGYDEHTDGSYEAGSVASYGYVKDGIENALKLVPNEKLINAVPFYTRLWFETPKTEEELAQEAGTEAANYPNHVTSTALGMDDAEQAIQNAGAKIEWDDEAKQNYAQWEADGGTYKIWLEDSQSLEEKLNLIKQNNLAGVAEWRIGWESSNIWDLILQYVN